MIKNSKKLYLFVLSIVFFASFTIAFLHIKNTVDAEDVQNQAQQELVINLHTKLQNEFVKNETLRNENKELKDSNAKGKLVYLGKFELTYYAVSGLTKTENPTIEGVTVAVDPKIIPLNTALYIDGEGVRYAHDTGGVVKGNIIDVYVNDYDKCIQNGRKKNVDVWIIK